MAKKINIIGAGIAGLSGGCYLQLNGFDTEIFEMHTLPGGLCTSWERNGYTFNGCLHWLVGTSPTDPFHQLWSELIDLEAVEFVHHDIYFSLENPQGVPLHVFTDLGKLKAEWLAKAHEDEREIRRFVRAVRKLVRFNYSIHQAPELQTWAGKCVFLLRTLPRLGTLRKYVRLTNAEYSSRFKNPLLARAVRELFVPGMSVIFSMFALAWMHKKNAGYPAGGSLGFARRIEARYLQLGGKIRYRSRVTRIVACHGRATGLALADGSRHYADIVISAADGRHTIWNLLGKEYADQAVTTLYREQESFPSLIQVSLGIKKTFSEATGTVRILLEQPLQIDPGTTTDLLSFTFYNFDPHLAPRDATVVIALIPTEQHEYWENLRSADPGTYALEKNRVAEQVIAVFEKRFGEIRTALEVIDVATPATYIRYTNNWKGSFEGWLLNPRIGFRQLSKTLPGLSDFYMIGQWVQPGGGLPGALLSARNVTQLICHKERQPFRTRQ